MISVDAFDLKMLAALQDDGRLTNQQLADLVGLSASQCSRRRMRLEEEKVIAGYHADGPRTVNMQSWNWKGIDVINAHERKPGVFVDALRQALGLVALRKLDPSALSTHVLPLERAAEAFALAEARPAGFVKAVIRP